MTYPTTMIALIVFLASTASAQDSTAHRFEVPKMWEYTRPLIAPEKREREPSHAQKDPTFVHHDGKWHVLMTVKLPGRSAIEYCSFDNWDAADASKRTLLTVSDSLVSC